MILALLFASVLFSAERNGISFSVECENPKVDPARSIFLTVNIVAQEGVKVTSPDLRDRVRGFSLAEDFETDPTVAKNGSVLQTVNWKLVPEPCAEEFRVAPFVVKAGTAAEPEKFSFVAGPLKFEPPAAREPVTGEFETDPKKDLPPFSWKLAGNISLWLLAFAALAFGGYRLARYVAQRVKEHRMSPIERAWVELDRLVKKGLPGRGRYKDFYVELTMVVRRYVQRKYGIRAPHLTTEEFLKAACAGTGAGADGAPCRVNVEAIRSFLESADMIKFAGVEATPEMADTATEEARNYLKSDDREARK